MRGHVQSLGRKGRIPRNPIASVYGRHQHGRSVRSAQPRCTHRDRDSGSTNGHAGEEEAELGELQVRSSLRFSCYFESMLINRYDFRYMCFDEADRMVDMGFEEDVRTIMSFFSVSPTLGAQQSSRLWLTTRHRSIAPTSDPPVLSNNAPEDSRFRTGFLNRTGPDQRRSSRSSQLGCAYWIVLSGMRPSVADPILFMLSGHPRSRIRQARSQDAVPSRMSAEDASSCRRVQ